MRDGRVSNPVIDMEAQEFGMWALAVFAWVFTAYSAVWLHAFVRDQVWAYWLEHQLRLRYLDQVDAGEENPFEE